MSRCTTGVSLVCRYSNLKKKEDSKAEMQTHCGHPLLEYRPISIKSPTLSTYWVTYM